MTRIERARRRAGRHPRTFRLVLALLVSLAVGGVLSLAATAQSDNVLKVGVNAPLSGPGAAWGQPVSYTWKAVAAQYNQSGGIMVGGERYRIEVVSDDNKWDPTTTRSVAQKQVSQDGVKFVTTVGDPSDPLIVPVTEKSKAILLDWTANKHYLRKPYKYVVGTFPGPSVMGNAFYSTLKKYEPKLRTVWFVGYDFQYDRDNAKFVRLATTRLGYKWLGQTHYPASTIDFTPVLGPGVAAKPDLFVLGGESGNAPVIVRTLRQLGFKGVIASDNAGDSLEDIVKGAKDTAIGMYHAEFFGYPASRAQKQFKARYQEASGGSWSTLGAQFWVQAQFLLKGIQRAGTVTDTDKIMQSLRSTRLVAPFIPGKPIVKLGGVRYYGRKAELEIPFGFNIYRGKGKFVTLRVVSYTN